MRVLFATNNSAPTRAEFHARLANCGITAADADLLSSADVAAEMLPVGSTALVLADDGVREALDHAGRDHRRRPARPTPWSWDGRRSFTFDIVDQAARTVRAGRPPDRDQRGPDPSRRPTGCSPGSGALLAAVATAAETVPEVAGKPHLPDRATPSRPGPTISP